MRRIPLVRCARLGVAAIALLLIGCSRALPDPPPTSPLTSASATVEPLAVDVALRGDPPLPGEAGQGWPGLVEPTSKGGHDHHGHHGHAKPEPAKTDEHEGHTKPEPAKEDPHAGHEGHTKPEPAKGGHHDH